MTVASLLITVGLLIINGVFVGNELALVAARSTKLQPRADEGNRRARIALEAMNNITRHLAGSQLGVTIASLALGFVAEAAIADIIERLLDAVVELPSGVVHTAATVVALLIVVFFHMVIGEIVPKNIAIASPEAAVMWLAPISTVWVTIFRPVIWVLYKVASFGVRLLGTEPIDRLGTAVTATELVTAIDASAGEGMIDKAAHELLSGAIVFPDHPVADLGVPRDEVVSVARASSVAEIEAVVRSSGHSRLPLVGASLDEIQGFVHSKDLLSVADAQRDQPLPQSLVRTMLEVRTDATLEDVLERMRRERRHFAVVRSPDGATAGIITLEDVLEELVGDIIDESDQVVAQLRR